MIMKASTRKTAVPTRPRRKKSGDLVKGVNDILIFELDIERDEDLQPEALLESFPGYDEEWTIAYLTALLEEEFTIELLDEDMAKLKTVGDVHNIVRRHLNK